ncbi:MAG TPA: hypothetical protein VGG30_01505, partial [Pirellulales bacterium]
ETKGVEAFVKVLDRQPPEVQQRVRDFLYYPAIRVSKERREREIEETKRAYPTLFPKGYKFGRSDPIFAKVIEP